MKRFFIGSLAVVGALSLLLFGFLVGLFLLLGASKKPGVPQEVVLELELSEPLPEYVPEGSLASAFGEDKLTVRDVVDALEREGVQKFSASWDELLAGVKAQLESHV